jgi:acetamidase/formamidase
MGIAGDLLQASRLAVENMIDLLGNAGLTDKEAYLVCSLIGHLRISEIVDEPNYVVSMVIPTALLQRIGNPGRFGARRRRQSASA